jgi:hypothetical protein
VQLHAPGAPVAAYLQQDVLIFSFCLLDGSGDIGPGIGFGIVDIYGFGLGEEIRWSVKKCKEIRCCD